MDKKEICLLYQACLYLAKKYHKENRPLMEAYMVGKLDAYQHIMETQTHEKTPAERATGVKAEKSWKKLFRLHYTTKEE